MLESEVLDIIAAVNDFTYRLLETLNYQNAEIEYLKKEIYRIKECLKELGIEAPRLNKVL